MIGVSAREAGLVATDGTIDRQTTPDALRAASRHSFDARFELRCSCNDGLREENGALVCGNISCNRPVTRRRA